MTKKTEIKAHDDPVRFCIERMIERGTAREIGTGKAALKEWDDLRNACMEATGHSFDWRTAFEQWLGEDGERMALSDFFSALSLSEEEYKAIRKRWPLIRELITDTILDQLPSLSSRITEKAMKALRTHVRALDDVTGNEPAIDEVLEKKDGVYKQLLLNLPAPKKGVTHDGQSTD